MRVRAVHRERKDCAFCFGLALDMQPVQARQALGGVIAQIVFVSGDSLHADILHVANGLRHTNNLGDGRRPSLEFMRRDVVSDLVFMDVADHVASAMPRAHLFVALAFRIERAASAGAVKLVPRDRVKIAAHLCHIDREMNRAL